MNRFLFYSLFVSLLVFQSCKKVESPTEPEQITQDEKIKTGTVINVTDQTVGTSGGTIKVSKPNDPLDGLEFTIQPNSFSQTQSVNISYSEVKSHQFGENFNPITPLINVQLTQSFSSRPMQLKIPIKLPTGYYATAFLYNKVTGELEGLPTEELTGNYIIVNSSHFSYTSLNKRLDDPSDQSNQVIVASTVESVLSGNLQISAGFDVGVDDWEFPNYGSYISPGGHCAGQSAAAIWYYAEKRTSLGNLFHKFDNKCDPLKPDLYWYDNPKGYRFCSIIQEDMDFGNWWSNWIDKINNQMKKPGLIWKNILVNIIIKRQPQLLLIRNTATGSGHAIICYKIDLNERKLYIADPNFPNNKIQTMPYTETSIGPYISRNNAGSPNLTFNTFGYVQLSQYIELRKIRERWKEFENNTIGNAKFPSYKLYVNNTNGAELTDGMTVNKSKLDVVCKSTQCDSSYSGTDNLQSIEFYDTNGNAYGYSDNSTQGVASFILNQGANKIGILVSGLKKGYGKKYVDFKWFTINYTPGAATLTIEPSNLDAALNGTYDFKAVYSGAALPSKYRCYWYFSGETSNRIKDNDMTMRHQFKSEGTSKVTVELFDMTSANPPRLGSASATVTVTRKPLSDLYGLDGLFLQLTGECEYNNSNSNAFNFTVQDFTIYQPNKLLWLGNNFTVSYTYPKLGVTKGDTTTVTGTISGTVASDGTSISTMTITESGKNNKTPYTYDFSITVNSFAIKKNIAPSFYTVSGKLTGSAVAAVVSSLSYRATQSNYPDPGWKEVSLKYFNYSSTQTPAELNIMFQ